MVSTKNPDTTYTLVPSGDESVLLDRAGGAVWITELIVNALADRKRIFADADARQMAEQIPDITAAILAKSPLTNAQKQKIKDVLAGT